ncbi:hypothetical protein CBOM_02643 [Ceraceosorus bombacis]|uniref:Uncharacterized protein n=1 Tax=Ceraceosorus bombacis TaxID=401625 RepID=A0A0P1BFP8_9BASI|nr:hypothetical protein CBOM_02643 [Ceraceosorus bombacis]
MDYAFLTDFVIQADADDGLDGLEKRLRRQCALTAAALSMLCYKDEPATLLEQDSALQAESRLLRVWPIRQRDPTMDSTMLLGWTTFGVAFVAFRGSANVGDRATNFDAAAELDIGEGFRIHRVFALRAARSPIPFLVKLVNSWPTVANNVWSDTGSHANIKELAFFTFGAPPV